MKTTLLLILLLHTIIANAQTENPLLNFINPSSVSAPKGYTHAVTIDLGNCYMMLIAGQVALDSTGNLVGKGDLKKQTEQAFLNLKNIVENAGGTMDNIVKLGVYLIDISQIQILRDVRDKFINLKNPPASTAIQVNKLFREGLLVEIDATAVIPKK